MPKQVWDKISKHPKFPLLMEVINIESLKNTKDSMKYELFNELKYKQTHDKNRASYLYSNKSDSNCFKEKEKHDTSLTNLIRPNGTKELPNSLWHINNFRFTVMCQNCQKKDYNFMKT